MRTGNFIVPVGKIFSPVRTRYGLYLVLVTPVLRSVVGCIPLYLLCDKCNAHPQHSGMEQPRRVDSLCKFKSFRKSSAMIAGNKRDRQ